MNDQESEVTCPIVGTRPGKLRGMTDDQIGRSLSLLYGCPTTCCAGVIDVHCLDRHARGNDMSSMLKQARDAIGKFGSVWLAWTDEPVIRIRMSRIAYDVIYQRQEGEL